MEIEQRETGLGDGVAEPTPTGLSPHGRAEQNAWDIVATLYRRWRFIAVVTTIGALASIAIALLLPKWFAAEARVLQPEGGALSILGGINGPIGGLSGLLGGGSGEYSRYLTILTSRSLMERMVEEFDLIRVYDIADDSEAPTFEAIDILVGNVEFEVNPEFLYLAVRAYDQDPERAAEMANYLVAALNEEHARLSSQNARQTRVFIEQRIERAQSDLDSVRSAMQAFQEEHGVVELESQARAFMESIAQLRGSVAELDVQYQTLARQYGPDNPQVQAAREALRAARGQITGALGGQDALLPVSMQALPALSRRYAELMQDQLIQAQIIEAIYPIYEQSLFQEQNEAVAVQVVDEAVPPVLAARPSRKAIVIAATISIFLLAVLYVLAHAWWLRSHEAFAVKLQQAVRDQPGTA